MEIRDFWGAVRGGVTTVTLACVPSTARRGAVAGRAGRWRDRASRGATVQRPVWAWLSWTCGRRMAVGVASALILLDSNQ